MSKKPEFKEEIFIFPVGESSNESIAKYPGISHDEIELDAECYFGTSKVKLPLYSGVSNLALDSFKKSNLSFYAFIKKSKDGKRQYFYSQRIDRNADSPMLQFLVILVSKIKTLETVV